MILIVVAMCAYVIKFFKTEGYACLSNPYNYSISLLEKANEAEVSCICTAYKEQGSVSVLLSSSGFEQVNQGNFQFPVTKK